MSRKAEHLQPVMGMSGQPCRTHVLGQKNKRFAIAEEPGFRHHDQLDQRMEFIRGRIQALQVIALFRQAAGGHAPVDGIVHVMRTQTVHVQPDGLGQPLFYGVCRHDAAGSGSANSRRSKAFGTRRETSIR